MTGSITKLADKLELAKGQIKRAREKGEIAAVRSMRAVSIIGGGAAVGLIRGLGNDKGGKAKIPGTQIDADLTAGVVAVMAGLTGVGGKASDSLVDFGSGMLAVLAAEATAKATDEFQAKK